MEWIMDRPKVVGVIGTLHLCVGVFGAGTLILSVAGSGMSQEGWLEFVLNAPLPSPIFTATEFMVAASISGAGATIWMLWAAAGLGMLMAKDRARRAAMALGVVHCVYQPIAGASLLYGLHAGYILYKGSRPEQVPIYWNLRIGVEILEFLIAVSYCCALWYFLTRPHVRAWFDAARWDGQDAS